MYTSTRTSSHAPAVTAQQAPRRAATLIPGFRATATHKKALPAPTAPGIAPPKETIGISTHATTNSHAHAGIGPAAGLLLASLIELPLPFVGRSPARAQSIARDVKSVKSCELLMPIP